MNILFFGSSQFAVPSLKALLTSGHSISCAITQPDRQKGRGLHLAGTLVKTVADESSIRIYQPQTINTPEVIKFLKSLDSDLFIVIAYGQILSPEILNIPKIFAINVHASILPEYRGAAPINWTIINGETRTGVTIIKMTKKMDAGPIILQKIVDINDNDTAITLEDKLSRIAAGLLIESLQLIQTNNYNLIPQDETLVSFAPKLKKEDGLISWNSSAQQIYNLIRGCLSWPGAFTYYNGKLLKIYKAKVCQFASSPVSLQSGEIVSISQDGLVVACGKDNLLIEELQIEGKRRMKVGEFIAGHKISVGEIFGKISCKS